MANQKKAQKGGGHQEKKGRGERQLLVGDEIGHSDRGRNSQLDVTALHSNTQKGEEARLKKNKKVGERGAAVLFLK